MEYCVHFICFKLFIRYDCVRAESRQTAKTMNTVKTMKTMPPTNCCMNARFQSVGKLANGVHEVYAVFDVYVRSVLVYLYLYHNFYAAVILKLDSLSYKAKVGTAAVLAMLELCCGEPNQN